MGYLKISKSERKKNKESFLKYKPFIDSCYETMYDVKSGRYVIYNTEFYGTITFYPGTGSFQQHSTERWFYREGINWLIKHISKTYHNGITFE